jgi:hypothetical protein
MYRAFGLLQPHNDFDLDTAAARLAERLAGSSSRRDGEVVTISKGNWEMYLAVVSGPHVVTETIGITDRLAGFEREEAEALASSNKRIEIWTDTPDPFMEHFNDYLTAVEVLKSFKGVVVVDPNEPSLL